MHQSPVSAIIPLFITFSLPYQPLFALRFSKLQLAAGWDCPVSRRFYLNGRSGRPGDDVLGVWRFTLL